MSKFAIEGARIFNGENVIGVHNVEVDHGRIIRVGGPASLGVERVDGSGATLLPGLIDTHTHSDVETLTHALRFGVTTEMDLFSFPETMEPVRRAVTERTDIADVRSASIGMTAPGGHPTQLRRSRNDPPVPTVGRPEDAAKFVDDRIAEGADYIKVMIESGKTLGQEVPVVHLDVVRALVVAAHARNRMVIGHALTIESTWQALEAGVDGFAHLFIDGSGTPELVDAFVAKGVFVIPTLNLLASLTGQHLTEIIARDPRVASRLPQPWINNLGREFETFPEGDFEAALTTVKTMHDAGVPILVGSDANQLHAPGLAHGASLHSEMQLLVRAGLNPGEVLRAATSVNAAKFGLIDRGRIVPGARADLVLVEGDPMSDIGNALSIRSVWRSGSRLAS